MQCCCKTDRYLMRENCTLLHSLSLSPVFIAMVLYNPKDWWKLIFAFRKSDTFRRSLPGILGVAAYATATVWVEKEIYIWNSSIQQSYILW